MALPNPQDTMNNTPPSPPTFEANYESPLYTEINIPLPDLPRAHAHNPTATNPTTPPHRERTNPSTHRKRAHTLSALPQRLHIPSLQRAPASSTPSSSPSPSSNVYTSADAYINPNPKANSNAHTHIPAIQNRETHAAMNLSQHARNHRRRCTVGALAVVPAVLVLSAELFTPGGGGGRVRVAMAMAMGRGVWVARGEIVRSGGGWMACCKL